MVVWRTDIVGGMATFWLHSAPRKNTSYEAALLSGVDCTARLSANRLQRIVCSGRK
jgi:hypothetical protein